MWALMNYLVIGAIFFWVMEWHFEPSYEEEGDRLQDFIITVLVWPLFVLVCLYVVVKDWLGENLGDAK